MERSTLSVFDTFREMIGDQPTWRQEAACRGPDVNPAWWFPTHGQPQAVARAKAICATCPVQPECLEAGRHERSGIWGGQAPNQRRGIRQYRAQGEPVRIQPRPLHWREERALAMRQQGWTNVEIAAELGATTMSQVHRWLDTARRRAEQEGVA